LRASTDEATTPDRRALRELLGKGSDGDRLRAMIGSVARRLLSLEVERLRGAGQGERTPERTDQRDGYRDRLRETRAGAVEPLGAALPTPKRRKGSLDPLRGSSPRLLGAATPVRFASVMGRRVSRHPQGSRRSVRRASRAAP
jgi:hypothetical protein